MQSFQSSQNLNLIGGRQILISGSSLDLLMVDLKKIFLSIVEKPDKRDDWNGWNAQVADFKRPLSTGCTDACALADNATAARPSGEGTHNGPSLPVGDLWALEHDLKTTSMTTQISAPSRVSVPHSDMDPSVSQYKIGDDWVSYVDREFPSRVVMHGQP